MNSLKARELFQIRQKANVVVFKILAPTLLEDDVVQQYIYGLSLPDFHNKNILIDLRNVVKCSSTFFFELAALAKNRKRKVMICNATAEETKLVQLVDPKRTIGVYGTYQKAMSALGYQRHPLDMKPGETDVPKRSFFRGHEKLAASVLILSALLVWGGQLIF